MLKADFHIHTKEDPEDKFFIRYHAKDLIRLAAKKGFDVLAITNHNHVFFNKEINSYAKKKGILLIPGAEVTIKRMHVLLLNVDNKDIKKLKHLKDLKKFRNKALIIAPHPYFITQKCLGRYLDHHVELFHAVEFSHFYSKLTTNRFLRFIDGNTKAVKLAKKHNLPLIGNSDAHKFYEFGDTYTLVDSAKNKQAVINAVKKGRVKLVTKPMPFHLFLRRTASAVIKEGILTMIKGKKEIKKYVFPKDLNNY